MIACAIFPRLGHLHFENEEGEPPGGFMADAGQADELRDKMIQCVILHRG